MLELLLQQEGRLIAFAIESLEAQIRILSASGFYPEREGLKRDLIAMHEYLVKFIEEAKGGIINKLEDDTEKIVGKMARGYANLVHEHEVHPADVPKELLERVSKYQDAVVHEYGKSETKAVNEIRTFFAQFDSRLSQNLTR